MIYKDETRSFYIHPGIICVCTLSVPDLDAEPNQALAMGESISEKKENIDQFMSEIMFPQYIRALRNATMAYLNSDLPEYFLHGHRVEVYPFPIWSDTPAAYNYSSDTIIIDADTLNIGSQGNPGQFVYGHEVGHRIMHFRGQEITDRAISLASSILALSDRNFLLEVMADAFGSLISAGERSRFTEYIEPVKQEGLQRAALRLAWSC